MPCFPITPTVLCLSGLKWKRLICVFDLNFKHAVIQLWFKTLPFVAFHSVEINHIVRPEATTSCHYSWWLISQPAVVVVPSHLVQLNQVSIQGTVAFKVSKDYIHKLSSLIRILYTFPHRVNQPGLENNIRAEGVELSGLRTGFYCYLSHRERRKETEHVQHKMTEKRQPSLSQVLAKNNKSK